MSNLHVTWKNGEFILFPSCCEDSARVVSRSEPTEFGMSEWSFSMVLGEKDGQ